MMQHHNMRYFSTQFALLAMLPLADNITIRTFGNLLLPVFANTSPYQTKHIGIQVLVRSENLTGCQAWLGRFIRRLCDMISLIGQGRKLV